MGWESFDEVRFGLGPLLQGQTRSTKLIGNHGLRTMVTGFGELSFRWIQMWIGSSLLIKFSVLSPL